MFAPKKSSGCRDCAQIFGWKRGNVLSPTFQLAFRITAEIHGVEEPGRHAGEGRASCGLNVGGLVGRGDRGLECCDVTDLARALCCRADGDRRTPVREHHIVRRAQDLAPRQPVTRRVHAEMVSEDEEHLGLVERDPARHAVRQARDHCRRVVREPLRTVAIEPAAPLVEDLGIVPVEEGDPWLDACREQGIDQPVVEAESDGIRGANAFGHHPRPCDRKAIRADA